MSNPRYNGWSQYGGFKGDITNSAVADTGVFNYIDIPADCEIESLEVLLTASDASTLKIGLYRDSSGDVPLVSDEASGATLTLTPGRTTATNKGGRLRLPTDYHPIGGVSTEADSALNAAANVGGGENAVMSNRAFNRIWYRLESDAGATGTLARFVLNCRY